MKKAMLVICPYPVDVAPSQRLKYEQYFPYFEAGGWAITVSPFMTRQLWECVYKNGFNLRKILWACYGYARRVRDLFRLRSYELVYIHLWVTPFGPPFFEWLFRLVARKVVYDIDDLIYIAPASRANQLIDSLKGRAKPLFLIRRAEQVIVCSPGLASFARQHAKNVVDISSTVDMQRYRPQVSYQQEKTLTLGWTGSFSTARYLLLLEPVLINLAKEHEFEILVIGDEKFRFSRLDCTAVAWHPDTEIENLRKIDIGLYPLPDEPWVLGKSGLKAIQYMALGIPVVASAIGASFRVIEHGVTGFLADSDAQWIEALRRLLSDVALRRQMGNAGRHRVDARFSVQANAPRYIKVLDDAIGKESSTKR